MRGLLRSTVTICFAGRHGHFSLQPMGTREEECYKMGLNRKCFFLFIMDRHMEPLEEGARATNSEEVGQVVVFSWSSVEV